MPQGLKNFPATFNRRVTHLLSSVRNFVPIYFDDVFVHSWAVNGKTDVGVHKEHLRKLLGLVRKHMRYANLKKCFFGASEIEREVRNLWTSRTLRLLFTSSGTTVACSVSDADTPETMRVSAQRLCTRPGADVAMPGIAAINKKRAEPVGSGRPTGSAVTHVYNGHATLKTAAPSERDSHCKKQDDKPNLVILKIRSKRENSLRALVDSGASNNFIRQQSLSQLNFEVVDTPRSVLEVRLATGATVRTEKRVVRVRFSYKHRVFVENLIVLDLDDKFDV
ncbi:hypothetical protein PC128_g23451 [Phytophthora cactorum]|nr:hypothetical protein PC128_g23451 [Phytophthora cactorum]